MRKTFANLITLILTICMCVGTIPAIAEESIPELTEVESTLTEDVLLLEAELESEPEPEPESEPVAATIFINEAEGGRVYVDGFYYDSRVQTEAGLPVKIIAEPMEEYQLFEIKVLYADGTVCCEAPYGEPEFSFLMPGTDVYVSVLFEKLVEVSEVETTFEMLPEDVHPDQTGSEQKEEFQALPEEEPELLIEEFQTAPEEEPELLIEEFQTVPEEVPELLAETPVPDENSTESADISHEEEDIQLLEIQENASGEESLLSEKTTMAAPSEDLQTSESNNSKASTKKQDKTVKTSGKADMPKSGATKAAAKSIHERIKDKVKALKKKYGDCTTYYEDLTGDGIKEAIVFFQYEPNYWAGEAVCIFTYRNGSVKSALKILDGGHITYGLRELAYYRSTNTLVFHSAGHGRELYWYYQMNSNGNYKQIAYKQRMSRLGGNGVDGPWSYSGKNGSITAKKYNKLVKKLKIGKKRYVIKE